MKCKNKGNGNSQKMQKLYFTFECLVEVQNSNFMQYFFFTRSSVNGGCFSDNASVSSAGLVAIIVIVFINIKRL